IPVPKAMVPGRAGVGAGVAVAAGAETAGGIEPEADGSGTIVAVAVGVACPPIRVGSVGLRLAIKRPMSIAPMIVAMTAPIEISEPGSVGTLPSGTVLAKPCRNGTPHDRQTCAHSGFGRPQLKQSTVSPVIGRGVSSRLR